MGREYEGYRNIIMALSEKFGGAMMINKKQLSQYMQVTQKTAARVVERNKIPVVAGMMDIHAVARIFAKGE